MLRPQIRVCVCGAGWGASLLAHPRQPTPRKNSMGANPAKSGDLRALKGGLNWAILSQNQGKNAQIFSLEQKALAEPRSIYNRPKLGATFGGYFSLLRT